MLAAPLLANATARAPAQILDVGGATSDPDISGLAFAPSGRRLYVGTEGGIAAYDVDTMSRRGFPAYELC
jgi:hypothetical protein